MVRVSAVAMVIVRVSARDWVNSTFSVMAIVSVRVRFMVILGHCQYYEHHCYIPFAHISGPF